MESAKHPKRDEKGSGRMSVELKNRGEDLIK
jgi:hypothetical protein